MDKDLEQMLRQQLIAEVKRLRHGIRQHRDSSGHDLCWHHPELWALFAGKNLPGTRGARLAAVSSRMREIPAVA